MKRTISIRGVEYPVQSLEGDLNFMPVLAYVKAEDLDNAEQKRKAAIAIKELCPKIPDSLIHKDGSVRLFIREWQSLIWDMRSLYFVDNLSLAKKTKQFTEEIRFAKGYAQFLAMREEYETQLRNLGEDEEDLPDVETSEELINSYHLKYYQDEIKLAEESEDSERVNLLKGRLQRLKDKLNHKGKVLAVHSQDETIEELQRQLAEEKKKNEKKLEI